MAPPVYRPQPVANAVQPYRLTRGIIQRSPSTFFPAMTGVPELDWFEQGSWRTLRNAIAAYSQLTAGSLFDRLSQLRALEVQRDQWLMAYLRATGGLALQGKSPPDSEVARKQFVQVALTQAINAEKAELTSAEAQYGADLGGGQFRVTGMDQSDFLKGTHPFPRKLGTASLAGLGDTDVPVLNALSSYTEVAYRLQNPLLRGGAAAFNKSLAESSELAGHRQAIALGTYTAANLLAETQRHNEMTKLALDRLQSFPGWVYRGTNDATASGARVGTVISDTAFASYSESQDVAFGFIDDSKEDPVMFKAQSRTGRITRDAVLGGSAGREVLFFPGTKFRVSLPPEIKKAGQKIYLLITMQEI